MLSSNVPQSERGWGVDYKGPCHCRQPPATKHIHVFTSTTQTTTMSGLPQQRYGSITQRRGRGDGSKATASRYVKIKGTSYRPNTRGKMNDLTAKNAFRR